MTHDFSLGPDSFTASAHEGGGSFVLDYPDNWKPSGDAKRGMYEFGAPPEAGVAAAYSYWYCAGSTTSPRTASESRWTW